MEIRPASAADEESVVALWRACGLVTETNDPLADFRLALLSGENSAILVGEDHGALVASAMVGYDGHRGWIYYLATSPAHRLRGFGRAMVAASESWMTERGVPKAQLMVRETNDRVVGFYRRLGYVAIPRVTMQKVLRKVEPDPSC